MESESALSCSTLHTPRPWLPGPRSVITDPSTGYFGTPVNYESLVPTGPARLGPKRFGEWLTRGIVGWIARPR